VQVTGCAASVSVMAGQVTVKRGEVSRIVASAVAAAARLGYPVVVKALAARIAHKTEAGAVAVNLRDAAAVRDAAARMLALSERVLVEEMVEDAVAEVLLGVGFDAQFGRYLIIGFGGAWVELIGDRQLLLPPVNRAMVEAALAKLKTAALLRG